MRLIILTTVAAAAAVLAGAPSASATSVATVIELRPAAACSEAVFLARNGATPVVPTLALYRVPTSVSRRVLAGLRSRGTLRYSAPNRHVGRLVVRDAPDPLVVDEWWRATIGVDTLTPPPAARPVTVVDSGLDIDHPEFIARPKTELLNTVPAVGSHGTAVSSVIGAPVNGLGVVGVYPEAWLRVWGAGESSSGELDLVQLVQGIHAAAAAGAGVVNLSFGSGDLELPVEQVVYEAVRKGVLVVASAGNSGSSGNPLGYPASIPHVLTVAASDRDDTIASFSSRSRFVDLAAPGVDIPVAVGGRGDWGTGSGTSFSAPLVSGAAAWVWAVRPELDATQLFEIMRRSARDIGVPGRDDAAGYGRLDVPAALTFAAPISDPLEPNDDVEFVRPGGLYDNSVPPLTTRTMRTTTLQARLDRSEDPRDTYRVWLPKNGLFTATVTTDRSVGLSLWKLGSISVVERFVGTDRLARGTSRGMTARLAFRNLGPGRFAYLAVLPSKGTRDATYRLRIR